MKESLEQKNSMEEKTSNDANQQRPAFCYRFNYGSRAYYMYNTNYERIKAHLYALEEIERRGKNREKVREDIRDICHLGTF